MSAVQLQLDPLQKNIYKFKIFISYQNINHSIDFK